MHLQVTAINYARLWKDIGNIGGPSYEYDSNMGIFRGAMGFVNQYLMALERVSGRGGTGAIIMLVCLPGVKRQCCGSAFAIRTHRSDVQLPFDCLFPPAQDKKTAFSYVERNELTLEVITLARYMIYFGFYDLIKLVELVKRL